MRFVAVDVETANPCLSSLCQVGVVVFDDRTPVESWRTLLNPDDQFADANIAVHGISERDVLDAPRFPDIYQQLIAILSGQVVAHHGGFDRVAFSRATDKYGLSPLDCSWLDTTKVVRRTWPERAHRGYGLSTVAQMLGIQFRHHAADEDARAAGQILVEAIRISGLALPEWLTRAEEPIGIRRDDAEFGISGSAAPRQSRRESRVGNPEGPFAGETIVFTGQLRITRNEAADLAAEAGCDVADCVTKATTLLVVGDQDIRRLAGHEKSTKHRKAEDLYEGSTNSDPRGRRFSPVDRETGKGTAMTLRVQRPFDAPPRSELPWDEKWRGPDRGLICCWERGRRLRDENPELAKRAEQGELVTLCFKGGTENIDVDEDSEDGARKKPKSSKRYGVLQYLAAWQGLRGEPLDIDIDTAVTIVCSRAKRAVIFRRSLKQQLLTTDMPPAAQD
jgi:DNA polymerase-3 subunit epsilon